MTEQELRDAVQRLRLHIKADPNISKMFADAVEAASKQAKVSLPKEFFDGLIIVHQAEMDSTFSVTILPVGSQCGLA